MKNRNLQGRVLNHVVCGMENKALMATHKAFTQKGFEVAGWVLV